MRLDEQVAGTGQKHSKAAGAFMRMEEQTSNLTGAIEIGSQRQRLVTKGPPELCAFLGQVRNQVAVEGILRTDRSEDLAGADDLAVRDFLQDEYVEVVAR